MKKRIFSIAVLIICFALCFAQFAGCKKDNKPDGGDTGDKDDSYYEDGTHDFDIEKTDGFILQNGKSDYKIVVSASASQLELTAADELQSFFYEATGVRLDRVNDTGLTHSAGNKYLSVGKNALSESAGVKTDGLNLGLSGVYVATADNTVFMLGEKDYGTLFSVYEFLHQTLNFETYSDNAIRLDKNVREISLYNYRIVDIPDFEYRTPGHGFVSNDATLRNRLRMTEIREFVKGQGGIYHNSFKYVTADDRKEHPLWSGGDQLCYTAHGNGGEYDSLVSHVTEIMKTLVKANPGIEIFSFTHEDTQTWCSCDACKKMIAEYNGAGSVTIAAFLQDVRDNVMEWFATDDGKPYERNFRITFFAYHGTNRPPTAVAADGTHSLINGFKLNGVIPYFAETNADYTKPLTEGEINKQYASNLAGWTILSDEILFWTYDTNFTEYLTPYNSFNSFAETYRYAAKMGAMSMFDQCQSNNAMSTSWERLKAYLNAKLSWNVNADVTALTEEFFENYYGPAAKTMLDLFTQFRVQGTYQNENGYTGSRSIFHAALGTNGRTYWPKNWVKAQIDGMTKALEEIESVKETDIVAYNAYSFNIKLERISPLYIMYSLYDGQLTEEDSASYKKSLKDDLILTGVSKVKETGDISEVIEKL